jgi:hypothetical protein
LGGRSEGHKLPAVMREIYALPNVSTSYDNLIFLEIIYLKVDRLTDNPFGKSKP